MVDANHQVIGDSGPVVALLEHPVTSIKSVGTCTAFNVQRGWGTELRSNQQVQGNRGRGRSVSRGVRVHIDKNNAPTVSLRV